MKAMDRLRAMYTLRNRSSKFATTFGNITHKSECLKIILRPTAYCAYAEICK